MSALHDLMRQRAVSAAEYAVLAANRPTPRASPDYVETLRAADGTWRVKVRHEVESATYREALVRTAAAVVRMIEDYDRGDQHDDHV